jgi:hypothetical protein
LTSLPAGVVGEKGGGRQRQIRMCLVPSAVGFFREGRGGSVVEHLPSTHKALGPPKKKKREVWCLF